MALTNAERQRLYRQRRREQAEANRAKGRKWLEVWVSQATWRRLQVLAEDCGSAQKAVETAIRELASKIS